MRSLRSFSDFASSIRLLPQFIPGHLNVLANSLSRRFQVLGSEWTLCQEAVRDLLRRWPANIDLFVMSLNHRFPVYFSPMIDQQSAGTDAMLQSWDSLQAYAFPPFGLIPRVLVKVRSSQGLEVTLVAPFWPQHPWFPNLLEIPFFLPRRRDLLRQPHFHHYHQNLSVLQLTAYLISSDPHIMPVSLQRWLVSLPTATAAQLLVNYQAKWAVYRAWCHRHGHSVSRPSVSKVADFLFIFTALSLSPTSLLLPTAPCSAVSFALFFPRSLLTSFFTTYFGPFAWRVLSLPLGFRLGIFSACSTFCGVLRLSLWFLARCGTLRRRFSFWSVSPLLVRWGSSRQFLGRSLFLVSMFFSHTFRNFVRRLSHQSIRCLAPLVSGR